MKFPAISQACLAISSTFKTFAHIPSALLHFSIMFSQFLHIQFVLAISIPFQPYPIFSSHFYPFQTFASMFICLLPFTTIPTISSIFLNPFHQFTAISSKSSQSSHLKACLPIFSRPSNFQPFTEFSSNF